MFIVYYLNLSSKISYSCLLCTIRTSAARIHIYVCCIPSKPHELDLDFCGTKEVLIIGDLHKNRGTLTKLCIFNQYCTWLPVLFWSFVAESKQTTSRNKFWSSLGPFKGWKFYIVYFKITFEVYCSFTRAPMLA